jgi:hypothetical protein
MNFSYGDGDDFDTVRNSAEELYQTIGSVPCPYFGNAIVAFNAKGIRHLKFKSDEKARPREDQYARLKLLHLAPKVLKLSRTVQGIWPTRQFELQKTHSRWESVLKDVCFYEFMAVLENVRIKVIVKEVAGGERYFWSIIPFWKLDPDKRRRILHSGDPEQD